ncbi:MAG: ribosome-recycling factor, partial [Bacillota bacterium]|nr:ribosome-recycling factor [Bacillota bacterium]
SDGTLIRIAIPQLTEERRKELVKVVKKKSEEAKVAVRNIRRDANDEIKLYEKEGEISEDDSRKSQEKVQNFTDSFIKKIDDVAAKKEAEILEV